MKRLAMFVMFLALGGFLLGCGGDKTKKKEPVKKPDIEAKDKDKDKDKAPDPEKDKEKDKEPEKTE